MTKLAIKVDPESIVIPKKPANKSASEHRKITKPIMEKKRRARINKSLDEIKDILKENYIAPGKKQQLEKADILEMAVQYLKIVTKKQPIKRSKILTESYLNGSNYQLIQSGFQDCKQQINKCLEQFNPQIKQRLNNHLNKFEEQQIESMDYDQVLNLSINDHMVINNLINYNTPNSASSIDSDQVFDFSIHSSPATPDSTRSMSPIELTVNRVGPVWRPW